MIPEFVADLRRIVGDSPLLLVGVTAVITRPSNDDQVEVLLVRTMEGTSWEPINGIMEPTEQPHETAVRESLEEAGVDVEPLLLAAVRTEREKRYPNGDRATFLNLIFRCEWHGGEPTPDREEVVSAEWFLERDLPGMSADARARVLVALGPRDRAWFGGPELQPTPI